MSLDAVREALLAEAQADAAELVGDAAERAAAQVARAEQERAALVERARAEGESAADLEVAQELAHARRRARTTVLEARRAVYDEVRSEARAAAERLRSEPQYELLLQRLTAHAREQLGRAADLQLDPEEGGVSARLGNRHVDYTLPALVERCLAEHAPGLERLWA